MISAETIADRLRSGSPPVVGRVENDRVLLDLRSVMPDEDGALERALRELGGGDRPEVAAPPGPDQLRGRAKK